jgi:predicted Fe-S protein YdhL (DUF1289 family)
MVWKCPPLHLPNWSNNWKWKTEMVKSPCIGKCTYDITIMSCNDCGRNKEEISNWYTMNDVEKQKVLERIANERCGGKDEDSSRHRD